MPPQDKRLPRRGRAVQAVGVKRFGSLAILAALVVGPLVTRPVHSAPPAFSPTPAQPPAAKAPRAMTIDDLLAVQVVSDPQVSPQGDRIVYTVKVIDRETGRSNTDLWLVDRQGKTPRQLTSHPGSDRHPRWSPDGRSVAFLSDRSGSTQVWLLPMDQSGEARQLTRLPLDVEGPIWSPQGDRLAAMVSVLPGKSFEETAETLRQRREAKSQAKIYDDLMVRHWDTWDDGTRQHVILIDVADGSARDLIPDWTAHAPPFFSGSSTDYAFSPDGEELAFISEPLTEHPWTTNKDVWIVSTRPGENGRSATPRNLTAGSLGAEAAPSYSPDGRFLAFLRQERAGFEADQWVLTLFDRQTSGVRPLTLKLDRPIEEYAWTADSQAIVATIDDRGSVALVRLDHPAQREYGPDLPRLTPTGTHRGIRPLPDGGVVMVRHHSAAPGELFVLPAGSDAQLQPLTHHNADLIASLDLNRAELFTFKGAEGTDVTGWLVKPPGFDPSRSYPVLCCIHGGPQGAWHDEWHERWNYALFAAPGYAVVAINPRGSTGFGQTFTDQISRDWTGRVYEDLMLGLDHALATYPFLDGDRVAALGGSYGGFMVNWIAGHTDRFKALVSHAGVFDLTSMYFTTEELWFPEWEFGGPPWNAADPKLYRAMSPSTYVESMRTPTLVIHGALDFRVPDSQGLAMFTALRRQGVPARYVWFPDENHWILKPANRIVWWREVHNWLDRYLR